MLTNAETDIVANMERIARKWHEGQFRKDGKTPYAEGKIKPEEVDWDSDKAVS